MTVTLGSQTNGKILGLKPETFTTHTTVVGMTGSGKTGVLLNMAEELLKSKIPVVILDIKGDMPNLLVQTDPVLAASMAPRIITPGANHGEPVNITSGLGNPERTSEAVTSLLDLVNVPSDPLKSRQHAFVAAVLENRHQKRQRCSLLDLVVAIQEPPFSKIGAMEIDEVISKTQRKSLAAKLNNVLVAKSFEHWREGIALDIAALTKRTEDSKTPVIVYSVAHLTSDDERMFAISLLCDEMVSYMRRCQGSDVLTLAFIVDECYGLMPPRGTSHAKSALLTLLKQGRAMGLGCVLATQNPMDLDYKGMANCGTWLIGRLQTANDRRRIVEGYAGANVNKRALEDKVGALKPRQFLLARRSHLIPFYTADVSCVLSGPMDQAAIRALNPVTPSVPTFKNRVVSLFTRTT